jgi:Zn-dependent protease with chaperone function
MNRREDAVGGELSPAVTLSVEQYRTVRQEEFAALQSQISTLRYGITGCVVLIGIAAQQHADKYLGWAISLALVPLVVLFSAVIWMGEYERMARAGHFVAILEGQLNTRLGDGWRPLRWESWLREGGSSESRIVGGQHRYLAIACVFIAFQVAAVAMGLHFYWHMHAHDPSRYWLIPTAVAVNFVILLMLLGYFRSSYERLRDFTADPEERRRKVRPRLRIRLRLYGTFVAVGFLSAPIWSWPVGFYAVSVLNRGGWIGHVSVFWAVTPTVIWMVLVPLLASRAVMHELLTERILGEHKITVEQLQLMESAGLLQLLTEWESGRLRLIASDELNASSIGRKKNIVLTANAVKHPETFEGALAHEVGHHRLQHLHPLALSYLYLWPYLYYDDEVLRRIDRARERLYRWGRRRRRGGEELRTVRALCCLARGLFTLLALPGWVAWVTLRYVWRTAEYDADRFAYQSGLGEPLEAALVKHMEIRARRRPRSCRELIRKGFERVQVEQGRALGYLPVPNEHPTPGRRLKRLRRWKWSRRERLERILEAGESEQRGR